MAHPPCPDCGPRGIVTRNGSTGAGKPKFKCRRCERQFVQDPQVQRVTERQKAYIDVLLAQGRKYTDIARITRVSVRWLYDYVHKKDNPKPSIPVTPG